MAKIRKNSKLRYYISGVFRLLVPGFMLSRKRILRRYDRLTDAQKAAVDSRVDYYCKLSEPTPLPTDCPTLATHRYNRPTLHGSKATRDKKFNYPSVYFFDSQQYTRYFDKHLRWNFMPGDITTIPDLPSIVKSRPIHGDNRNSVLLKLNKVRHFNLFDDQIPFEAKEDCAIFRGSIEHKPHREDFMRKFYGHPLVDCGIIDTNPSVGEPEWRSEKLSHESHCRYKFIVSLEGNDVASNLKWIMHSGSIAVMPRPRYETWFMEGRLEAGVHYIEVQPDYSDLESQLSYYLSRPDLCRSIVRSANSWVGMFMDVGVESLCSVMVLSRYFKLCN